jgi:hypothetical protein
VSDGLYRPHGFQNGVPVGEFGIGEWLASVAQSHAEIFVLHWMLSFTSDHAMNHPRIWTEIEVYRSEHVGNTTYFSLAIYKYGSYSIRE